MIEAVARANGGATVLTAIAAPQSTTRSINVAIVRQRLDQLRAPRVHSSHLTTLSDGQEATGLQLPAQPATAAREETQNRLPASAEQYVRMPNATIDRRMVGLVWNLRYRF
jgi:hypothetical protein